MAGGLFKDVPFRFNIKCIVFSVILMIVFALAPVRTTCVLYAIPVATAVTVFAYHKLYKCKSQPWVGMVFTSLTLMTAYWFSPERTRMELIMYFFIFVYGYVGLAFYDYIFDCTAPLKEGVISLTAIFKPGRDASIRASV